MLKSKGLVAGRHQQDNNDFYFLVISNVMPEDTKGEEKLTTIMPEGEAIRKAVKWISANHEEKPDIPINKLINEAVMKFDLSPLDSEFLRGFFKQG